MSSAGIRRLEDGGDAAGFSPPHESRRPTAPLSTYTMKMICIYSRSHWPPCTLQVRSMTRVQGRRKSTGRHRLPTSQKKNRNAPSAVASKCVAITLSVSTQYPQLYQPMSLRAISRKTGTIHPQDICKNDAKGTLDLWVQRIFTTDGLSCGINMYASHPEPAAGGLPSARSVPERPMRLCPAVCSHSNRADVPCATLDRAILNDISKKRSSLYLLWDSYFDHKSAMLRKQSDIIPHSFRRLRLSYADSPMPVLN